MIKLLLGFILDAIRVSVKCFLLFLPSLLVYTVLTQPAIIMNRGLPLVEIANQPLIHELLPHTRWGDLKPCGTVFDEQEEFNKARQCVNQTAWRKRPVSEELEIPRCYIVSASSPDVYSEKTGTFNFIPVVDIYGIGAVLGVYQPETRTVFIVENIDAAQVYRHETQHYMLHEHDPETRGGGHHQEIWQSCEAPYYSPSIEAKMIGAIKDFSKPKAEK